MIKFKVFQQDDVVAQVAPNLAREGWYAEHQFEHSASGLFGEELPGLRLSKEGALELYRNIPWLFFVWRRWSSVTAVW